MGADPERFEEAQKEIKKMLDEPLLAEVTLLILANKQDLPRAVTSAKLTDALNLRESKQKWKVQGCCATTGDGLFDGLDWLAKELPASAKTSKGETSKTK